MPVKKAAELMGVGRPALSNLLNGKASLSPEMALRLEKVFGAKARSETLLQMQAAYDEIQARHQEKAVAVRTYAPSFMDITAAQISAWADQTAARSHLAALLRRLVVTTGINLSKVDFPAYDNAQRPGWDGQVETDTPTPWIPAGLFGWEFGCDQNPKQKAQKDYAARQLQLPQLCAPQRRRPGHRREGPEDGIQVQQRRFHRTSPQTRLGGLQGICARR
jgi:addiction module HigA family antidote